MNGDSQELFRKKLEELKEKRRQELLGGNLAGENADPEVLPAEVSQGLKTAPDRDAVAGVLLDFIGKRYNSGALLISKDERALGWKGVGTELSDELVQMIRIPLEVPTTLNEAAREGMAVIPEPGKHSLDKMLRRLLRATDEMDVVVTAVYYRRVVVCFLVALVPAGSLSEEATFELKELARLAGEAFARLIAGLRKKES